MRAAGRQAERHGRQSGRQAAAKAGAAAAGRRAAERKREAAAGRRRKFAAAQIPSADKVDFVRSGYTMPYAELIERGHQTTKWGEVSELCR